MLKSIWKYRHLADPTATIRYTGKADSAPTGKWAFSDDPKTNLALWNTLGVAATTVPATAALTILANKYWDKWLEKKISERSLSKINALRPQMSPNDDLDYTYNITSRPKEELKRIEEESEKQLSKEASDPVGTEASGGFVKDSALSAIPLVAAPVATYLTIKTIQNRHKAKLKKRLMEERIALRNLQDNVDHQILREQGLIKDASMTVDEAESIWDIHGRGKDAAPVLKQALTLPAAALLGLSAIGGVLAYRKLSDTDKHKNRLKYLRDHILGSNTLQESPKISMAKFDKASMVARPGDKVAALLEDSTADKDFQKRTGLEEVTSTELVPAKKSDALF